MRGRRKRKRRRERRKRRRRRREKGWYYLSKLHLEKSKPLFQLLYRKHLHSDKTHTLDDIDGGR